MEKIKKKILDWFKKSDGDQVMAIPKDNSMKFSLVYKDIVIGFLEVKDQKWKFYYSEEFKLDSDLNYISGFPDLNKTYYNDSLWPFFKIRIPGLGQPDIQSTLEEENISKTDEIALLKRFGNKSISNPYLLNLVS